MKKIFLTLLIIFSFTAIPVLAKTTRTATPKPLAVWKPATPDGYSPITWAKAPGIITFFKAPTGNGSIDFLTRIYLPQNQIDFIASSSVPLDWGIPAPNFIPNATSSNLTVSETNTVDHLIVNTSTPATNNFHNFAFVRLTAELAKQTISNARFIWNAPFFNITDPISDLSLALKTTNGTTTLITSGSRPPNDIVQDRRMLVINNQTASAIVEDFDPINFVSSSLGDQAIEGFAPTVAKTDSASDATGRLFLGVSPNNKELVVYCSQQATVSEASEALVLAGIPPEHQMEVDGGGSATCGYNLPGQFFVEPTRMLPLLMGAETILSRGVATTNGMKVRSGPATKYPIVTKLSKSTLVRVYEEKNGWLRIGKSQWVLKTLIKKT